MITLKSSSEFKKMRTAGACVGAVHEAMKLLAVPGATTRELDAAAYDIIHDQGCTPSFLGYLGYEASICASPNSVVVHGIPGDYALADGDVITVDVGAIFQGWHGDAAVALGVGDISDEDRRLIDVTERAMWAGLAAARPGNRVGDISAAVQAVGDQAGFGIVREYVGHGIGKNMHEDPQIPNYGEGDKGLKLREGMALCVEPMFNAGAEETAVLDDGWTVVTLDGSRSCHWEHTVALTPDGMVVTTVPAGANTDLALLLQRA
jgi:methionyl aminopeptidase